MSTFALLHVGACSEAASSAPDATGGVPSRGGSTSLGGAGGNADPGCSALDEAECGQTLGCEPIRARAPGEEEKFVGCRYSGTGDSYITCGAITPCGYPSSEDGTCYLFQSDCLPEGWKLDISCDDRSACAELLDAGGAGGGAGAGNR